LTDDSGFLLVVQNVAINVDAKFLLEATFMGRLGSFAAPSAESCLARDFRSTFRRQEFRPPCASYLSRLPLDLIHRPSPCLFSQVMDFVPWASFERIVARYGGDVRVRRLRCGEQFRIMAFAQMTYRESLRGIEACLGAQPSKLYGMGLREAVARPTLADGNELRDWRIWADVAAVLIRRARKLYVSDDIGLDLANTVYALDSTTIDLCLSLFPWADFRSTKAAVKMHTLLDLRGPIPCFIHVADGKMGDAVALDLIVPEAGAIYVMRSRLCRFSKALCAPSGWRLLRHARQNQLFAATRRAERMRPAGPSPRAVAGCRRRRSSTDGDPFFPFPSPPSLHRLAYSDT
jgi:hypothetical protein